MTWWADRSGRTAQRASQYNFRLSTVEAGLPPADEKGRTRGAAANAATLAAAAGGVAPARPARGAAPTKVGGQNIFRGNRPGISAAVRTAWWATHAGDLCAQCGTAMTAATRSIDHVTPVSDLILSVDTQTVKVNGWHWTVALQADVQKIEDDSDNFRSAHKICNSEKGGFKGGDSLAPQKASCPTSDEQYDATCGCTVAGY